jgi:hypothetical protein
MGGTHTDTIRVLFSAGSEVVLDLYYFKWFFGNIGLGRSKIKSYSGCFFSWDLYIAEVP